MPIGARIAITLVVLGFAIATAAGEVESDAAAVVAVLGLVAVLVLFLSPENVRALGRRLGSVEIAGLVSVSMKDAAAKAHDSALEEPPEHDAETAGAAGLRFGLEERL